jgi:hypothetical protein
MMYYCNFVSIPSKMWMTPAMSTGISDRLSEALDIIVLVEANKEGAALKKCALYKNLMTI